MVPAPPDTTEKIGPSQCATKPDSKPPSSFEVPMNKLFTAETRPRFSSGVSNCTSVCRTSTLTWSATPQTKSISHEKNKEVESPKAIVASPKPATDQSRA